ncbi:synaptosomal-associated protein 25-like [Oscarella lobularis]|uniref:synaptosomal-associated protein 25-like n=1 Tax=Oscarella lobularis TaxID=121494 RepID=UPI003313F643
MELNEEQMRAELAEMAAKADRITDESLESTRRMLTMAVETETVGGKTLDKLYDQGEQLDRINEGLDQINADMKSAEKNLTEMEKCCGLCVCPWNRKRNIEKTDEYKQTWDERDGVVVTEPGAATTIGSQGARSGYIKKVLGDDREDEMDENLGQVDAIVGNLKGIAIDMGNELMKQNDQIDIMNQKAEMNDVRVREADKRTKDLINS